MAQLHHRSSFTARRRNAGFSLIEILVAVVVLSLGVLGVAGMQLTALRSTQQTGLRSIATQLAYDITDRIRSNIQTQDSYLNVSTAPAVTGCYGTTVCTTANVASNDMAEWLTSVAERLPGGTAIICRDANPRDGSAVAAANNGCNGAGPMVIKIWWVERDANGQNLAVMPQEPNFYMVIRP